MRACCTEAVQRFDDQWLRILDVDTALAARTYGPASSRVTIDVSDPMFPTNTDAWTISATGTQRTDQAADVQVDIGALSAAYLGMVSWRDLASIGALDASEQSLTQLDALFGVRPTPFCGTGY